MENGNFRDLRRSSPVSYFHWIVMIRKIIFIMIAFVYGIC